MSIPWAILLPLTGGISVLAFHAAGGSRRWIRLWSGTVIGLTLVAMTWLSTPGKDVAWTRVAVTIVCATALISTVASSQPHFPDADGSATRPAFDETNRILALILLSLAAVAMTCQSESVTTLVAAQAAFFVSALTASRLAAQQTDFADSIPSPLLGDDVCRADPGENSAATGVRPLSANLRHPGAWLLPISLTLLLAGAAFLIAVGGSDRLAEIQRTLHNNYQPEREETRIGTGSILGTVAFVFLLAGAAIPFAAFPFHFHLSKQFEKQPNWVVLWIAVAGRAQAFVLLWRVAVTAMPGFGPQVQTPMLVITAASALAGALLACRTTSLRGIASGCWLLHGGILLHCVATGAGQVSVVRDDASWQLPPALETGLLTFVCSSLSLAVVLLVESSLTPAGRRQEFDEDLTGLARQRPSTGGALATALLSFCAIPPLASFWGMVYLSAGAFVPQYEASDSDILIPNAAVLLAAAVLIAALLILAARTVGLISLMLFDEPIRRHETRNSPALLIAGVLAAGLIFAGLLPGPLLRMIHSAL